MKFSRTLSPSEIAKELDIDCIIHHLCVGGNLVGVKKFPEGGIGKHETLLSIGSQFPTGGCETCGCSESNHSNGEFGRFCFSHKTYLSMEEYPSVICNEFKPELGKVVGIEMVEECKCGHEQGEECDICGSKPMQKVKITMEVD